MKYNLDCGKYSKVLKSIKRKKVNQWEIFFCAGCESYNSLLIDFS